MKAIYLKFFLIVTVLLFVFNCSKDTESNDIRDTDADGVIDSIDKCPNTPEGSFVDANGCSKAQINPVYLDENGVTVKCYDLSEVGQTGEINGVIYRIVDEDMLRGMIANNKDITRVCTSKITDMSELLTNKEFNQDISSWDVSNVTDMRAMFLGSTFNQDISSWDVSSVISMSLMFQSSSFNQPIGIWDVSNVTSMFGMFAGTSSFNQDIANWDVSNVTHMASMFKLASSFNQDISDWDVSNVTLMYDMFIESPFNQDLSSWNVSNVTNCSNFSKNTLQWTEPKPNFTNCTP